MSKILWRYWCKAIGNKAFADDKDADIVATLRTIWVILHIATCLFIIIGNGRVLELW